MPIIKMDEENKIYEISFLTKTEDDRREIEQAIKKYQMSIIEAGQWARIKLAYPIKKENFAYFGYLIFSGEPQSAKSLSNEFKNSPGILRFLIISNPVLNKKTVEAEIVLEEKIPAEGYGSKIISFQPGEVESRPTPPQATKKIQKAEILSNEALKKKTEETRK